MELSQRTVVCNYLTSCIIIPTTFYSMMEGSRKRMVCMKYCLQYSDAIRKSNTDVYSGINQHCRKSAYFSVGPLESVSIGGVHKMEWQVASKRQHRKEFEEKLAFLKYRLSLVTC